MANKVYSTDLKVGMFVADLDRPWVDTPFLLQGFLIENDEQILALRLAARLDRNLLAGRMSAAMRDAIVSAVNAIPATNTLARSRAAFWLVVTSPQFQVQR